MAYIGNSLEYPKKVHEYNPTIVYSFNDSSATILVRALGN